jgi:Domain of unknown function (DUF4375)
MTRTFTLVVLLAAVRPAFGQAPPAAPADPVAALRAKLAPDWNKYLTDELKGLKLTKEEIEKTDERALARKAFDRAKFVEMLQASANYAHLRKEPGAAPVSRSEVLAVLPRPWRAVYVATRLDGQVFNGGIFQFFWNTDGEYNGFLVDDLNFLGATEQAGLMAKAIKIYAGRNDLAAKRGAADVRDGLERFAKAAKDNPYQQLTRDYYGAKAELTVRIGEFIKANPDLFTRPPKP